MDLVLTVFNSYKGRVMWLLSKNKWELKEKILGPKMIKKLTKCKRRRNQEAWLQLLLFTNV